MKLLKYIDKKYNNIIIFTNLDDDPKGLKKKNMCLEKNGFTCCWVIAKYREIEKVILYIREGGINKIYQADYNYRENVEGKRYKIHYKNLKFLETSIYNWKEFTNSQSPIRYIDK